MPNKGYWIGRVDVADPEAYKKYVAANAVPFAKYGARFLVRGGNFENRTHPRVPHGKSMHRRKKAYPLQTAASQRTLRAFGRIGSRGVEHEIAVESRWKARHRPRDGILIAGKAGDQSGLSDACAIQLLRPNLRQLLRLSRRQLPAQRFADSLAWLPGLSR